MLNRTINRIGVGLLVALGVLIVIITLGILRGERPPFEYLDAQGRMVWGNVTTYPAEDSVLCPGDPLVFTVAFRVNEVPVNIRREYTFRPVRDGIGSRAARSGYFDPLVRNVEPGAGLSYTTPTVVEPTTYRVPTYALTPGSYVLSVIAKAEDRPDNAFQVFFTVEDCDA